MNLNFMEQIDEQLQKIAQKKKEDPFIRVDCPACGAENKIHRMRAKHGHVMCTECRTFLVIMMKRD